MNGSPTTPVTMVIKNLLRAVVLVICGALPASCGGPPALEDWTLDPTCAVLEPPERPADVITIALLDDVEPVQAPWARNEAEALLFGQLYETLINIDCAGDVRSGLARSWTRRDRGRVWDVELRPDARFSDGTPVTATDVAWSWRHAAVDRTEFGAVVDSIHVIDDRRMRIHVHEPHRKPPRSLASPVFAVAKPSNDLKWLLGSGPFEVRSTNVTKLVEGQRPIVAVPLHGRAPTLRFWKVSQFDARDLLAGTVDLIVTREPVVIEYGARQPNLTITPLPWDRTHVLFAPSRAYAMTRGHTPASIPPEPLERFARDAVHVDARGSSGPHWWEDIAPECSGVSAPPLRTSRPLPTHQVLFDRNDPVARDLAARIVALASVDRTASEDAARVAAAVPGFADMTAIKAVGLNEDELERSLRHAEAFAYILSLPARPYNTCYEARRLSELSPWRGEGVSVSDILVPLVDTRPHVIASTGKFGLSADWFGNVRITMRRP